MTHKLPKTSKWCQPLVFFSLFLFFLPLIFFQFPWLYIHLIVILLSPFLCLITLSSRPSLPDHGPQTVEARIWWIGREPQQHKCRHVYAETLREVSYHVWQLHATHYAYTHGAVCIARGEWTPSQLHQIWFHNALFITSGHHKTKNWSYSRGSQCTYTYVKNNLSLLGHAVLIGLKKMLSLWT